MPVAGPDGKFVITLEDYEYAREDYIGFCRACGEERDMCEPDAENYDCPGCGLHEVFGAEEFLICGWMTEEDSPL